MTFVIMVSQSRLFHVYAFPDTPPHGSRRTNSRPRIDWEDAPNASQQPRKIVLSVLT